MFAPARRAARANAGPARRGLAWPSSGDSEPPTTSARRSRSASQLLGAEQFQVEAQRLHVLRVLLQHRRLLPRCSRRAGGRGHELQVLAQQFLHAAPDGARAIGERHLRQRAALAAHVAEVDAAGLAAHQLALEQRDATAVLAAQEESRGGAHQAAADDQHVAVMRRAAHCAASRAFIISGLTGACVRSRPTCSDRHAAGAARRSRPPHGRR